MLKKKINYLIILFLFIFTLIIKISFLSDITPSQDQTSYIYWLQSIFNSQNFFPEVNSSSLIQSIQIENSFELIKNGIDVEIEQSNANYKKAYDKFITQKENMNLAKEVFDVTKIKYEEGVGSNSEVLDADTALKESQTNYYNALYDALVAKIDLQKAYGTLLKAEQ